MNKSDYLLILVGEKALEVSHRVSKALRFGLMEIQKGQPWTNAHRIEREINDLRGSRPTGDKLKSTKNKFGLYGILSAMRG